MQPCKRTRVAAVPWAELMPVLLRYWAAYCTIEDYANSAVACKSWRLALKRDLDAKTPLFVTSEHRATLLLGKASTQTIGEYILTRGVRSLRDRTQLYWTDFEIVPYRYRYVVTVHDPLEFCVYDESTWADERPDIRVYVNLEFFVTKQFTRAEPSAEAMVKFQQRLKTIHATYDRHDANMHDYIRRLGARFEW